jgi:hypothetical protein
VYKKKGEELPEEVHAEETHGEEGQEEGGNRRGGRGGRGGRGRGGRSNNDDRRRNDNDRRPYTSGPPEKKWVSKEDAIKLKEKGDVRGEPEREEYYKDTYFWKWSNQDVPYPPYLKIEMDTVLKPMLKKEELLKEPDKNKFEAQMDALKQHIEDEKAKIVTLYPNSLE